MCYILCFNYNSLLVLSQVFASLLILYFLKLFSCLP
nr:MAG TPA: hypothetical protein [Caudoviricetes sp.]